MLYYDPCGGGKNSFNIYKEKTFATLEEAKAYRRNLNYQGRIIDVEINLEVVTQAFKTLCELGLGDIPDPNSGSGLSKILLRSMKDEKPFDFMHKVTGLFSQIEYGGAVNDIWEFVKLEKVK